MSQSIPIQLANPSPKDAIVDALYRACLGFDTNDRALFDSAWMKSDNDQEPIFENQGLGQPVVGMAKIHKDLFEPIGKLVTTHFITNVRITAQDATTASFTASALAQHYPPGMGIKNSGATTDRLLSGSIYWVDVTKDENDGLWKIKKWSMRSLWFEGDLAVVAPK